VNGAEWRCDQSSASALGHRRLARQQSAEILKADRAGQQRQSESAESDPGISSPPPLIWNFCPHAHATPQQNNAHACRPIGGNAT
jgi:hypothetical protein